MTAGELIRVSPLAFLICENGLEQVPLAEVGPQRVGDPDLRVRDLPEQEVADPHLAARPDQQVGIGLARGIEKISEALLVQLVGADARRHDAARGFHDFGAAAVVERDVEQHAAAGEVR